MVVKTYSNKNPITETDLNNHLGSAHEIMTQSKKQAATAIGHLWLIWANIQSGEGKKWFKQQIENYNDHAEAENLKIDARFEEADKFMKGELASDHDAVKKTSTQQEKDLQEALKNTLRSDAALDKAERRKLKYVIIKDRQNSNEFADIVRIGFKLFLPDQTVLVSRNCSAMEFVKTRFADKDTPTIDDIVSEFERVGGFDAAIEEQRLTNPEASLEAEIRAVGKAAIRAAARERVRKLPAIAQIEMPINRSKDGFANVLVRVNGKFVDIVAEADAPDVEIESTVNRVGSFQQITADPKCEVAGRLLEFARLVPFGNTIMSEDGKTKLGTSQQFITMRPGSDNMPELVVSSSHVEAGPVLVAKPHDQELMGLKDEYAVVRGDDRKKLEKAFYDQGERSIRSITVDLEPKKADGRAALSPMSWMCENVAVKDANEKRIRDKLKPLPAVEQVYWDDFNSVTHKPLDIDGFTPQLAGLLTAGNIEEILDLFPKPGDAAKGVKEGAEKGKVTKVPRTVELTFEKEQLKVIYGDADPLVLDCKTRVKGAVSVRMRMQDLMGLFTSLRSHDCQKVEIEPDDRGLVKFGWEDSYASYAIHIPTCSADAKLSSKRVATMRAMTPALAQAAE